MSEANIDKKTYNKIVRGLLKFDDSAAKASADEFSCELCAPGRFHTGIGLTECDACAMGRWRDLTGGQGPDDRESGS